MTLLMMALKSSMNCTEPVNLPTWILQSAPVAFATHCRAWLVTGYHTYTRGSTCIGTLCHHWQLVEAHTWTYLTNLSCGCSKRLQPLDLARAHTSSTKACPAWRATLSPNIPCPAVTAKHTGRVYALFCIGLLCICLQQNGQQH